MRNEVVLLAPLGSSKPMISLARQVRSTPSTTCLPARVFCKPRTSSKGESVGVGEATFRTYETCRTYFFNRGNCGTGMETLLLRVDLERQIMSRPVTVKANTLVTRRRM